MADHVVVKEKDWREDVQLPDKSKDHSSAFLEMLGEFESMMEGHMARISVEKHRMNLLNNDVGTGSRLPCRAETTTGKFATAEVGLTIIEMVNKKMSTKLAAPTVFVSGREALFVSALTIGTILPNNL